MKAATLEKKTVRAKAKHPTEMIRRIQKGLPFSDLKALQDSIDMPFEQLAAKLSMSRSTLQRRKANGRLSPDESDKVMRFARLLEHAADVFGDIDKARAWLKHPQYGGRWNSPGVHVVYVSEHQSTAAFEIFIHRVPFILEKKYKAYHLEWPNSLTEIFPVT